MDAGLRAIVLLMLLAATADANDVIRVETLVGTDSVTVGERFRVQHVFAYPDTVEMVPTVELNAGRCRIISMDWSEEAGNGEVKRTADLVLMTLDLDEAVLPPSAFRFRTAAGDTLLLFTDPVIVPVRRLVADEADVRSLKQQWVAPRSFWKWVVGGALALIAAAAIVYLLRRRRKRVVAEAPKPRLPADYVALTELNRIEKLGLIERGKFKEYYTLVIDALRKYLEERYGIEAMDQTTTEILWKLDRVRARVDGLESLLAGADLVKFAKHVPKNAAATQVLRTAREIVVTTAPRRDLLGTGTDDRVAGGPGG